MPKAKPRSRKTRSELRENNQQGVQPLHQQVLQRRARQSPPDVQPPVQPPVIEQQPAVQPFFVDIQQPVQPPVSQSLVHQPTSVNFQPPVIVQQPAVQPFLVDVQQPVQHQLLNVQPPMHQHGQPQHEQPQSVERRQLSDVESSRQSSTSWSVIGTGRNPGFVSKHFQTEIDKLAMSSMSDNTLKTYNNGLSLYKQFTEELNKNPAWPPSVESVLEFIAYMSLAGYSFKTVNSYISALSFQCKLNDFIDPTQHFLVRKVLKGYMKVNRVTDIRLPISYSILITLLKNLHFVCTSSYEAILFQAAFCLAYFALLRISEFVPSNPRESNKVIQLSDVEVHYKCI
ncbi:uncharacterized protein LOC132733355 isoform X4 [Ruditapes philippinarum]|uniref:uncharacterized protein LOC132733355 isoform X4 n=1 Tax=Ruditapes philippinarum TaxID=129788 RepID=UPI00295C3177|nr:uncharacterized protein LOC132733355 isoform X4 [Ruditapes philippinarum]